MRRSMVRCAAVKRRRCARTHLPGPITGIFLQLVMIISVVVTLGSDSVARNRFQVGLTRRGHRYKVVVLTVCMNSPQISVFLAVALVFAVLGVK